VAEHPALDVAEPASFEDAGRFAGIFEVVDRT